MLRFATPLDDVATIARLVYETDHIIPYLFGERSKALPKIESLVKKEHNSFSYQHILVFESSAQDIKGILLAYSPRQKRGKKEGEDYSQVFSIFELMVLWFKSIVLKPIENKSAIDGLYIQNISVDASARGEGIGTKFIDFIEKWASNNGYFSLWLDVAFSNEKARKLYERQGFMVVSRHRLLCSKQGFFRMKKVLVSG